MRLTEEAWTESDAGTSYCYILTSHDWLTAMMITMMIIMMWAISVTDLFPSKVHVQILRKHGNTTYGL
jgi:hypothetical protein